MEDAIKKATANADYIGIINALNWLVSTGIITAEDGKKTAARIAGLLGISILIV